METHSSPQSLCRKCSPVTRARVLLDKASHPCRPNVDRAGNETTENLLQTTQPTATVRCAFHYFQKRDAPTLKTFSFSQPNNRLLTGPRSHKGRAYPGTPLALLPTRCENWDKAVTPPDLSP